MASCEHTHCEAHLPNNRPVNWDIRPLPCRLGLHGHYSASRDIEKTVYLCLVCKYVWTHEPPPMLGMGE